MTLDQQNNLGRVFVPLEATVMELGTGSGALK